MSTNWMPEAGRGWGPGVFGVGLGVAAPGGGAGLDPGILRVGIGDRVPGRRGERGGDLEVLGVGVGRAALACRHAGPADLLADELLVVLAGGPGDELPGLVLLLARLLDSPG